MTWTSRFPGYRIVSRLGTGGMAEVFRAERLRDRTLVALKTLRTEKVVEAEPRVRRQFQQRVEQEFDVASRLSGLCPERWVRVFEGRLDHDPPFYTMELIEGGTVDDYRRRHGPLPLEDAIWIVREAALAVGVAHDILDVVHRHLTVKNLLLRGQPERGLRRCQVVGADCGICHDPENDEAITLTGQRMGVPYAMAPEQLDPDLGPTDQRTDVWALGVMLYYLSAGTKPFRGEDETLTKKPPCLPGRTWAWKRSTAGAWPRSRAIVTRVPGRWRND